MSRPSTRRLSPNSSGSCSRRARATMSVAWSATARGWRSADSIRRCTCIRSASRPSGTEQGLARRRGECSLTSAGGHILRILGRHTGSRCEHLLGPRARSRRRAVRDRVPSPARRRSAVPAHVRQRVRRQVDELTQRRTDAGLRRRTEHRASRTAGSAAAARSWPSAARSAARRRSSISGELLAARTLTWDDPGARAYVTRRGLAPAPLGCAELESRLVRLVTSGPDRHRAPRRHRGRAARARVRRVADPHHPARCR